MMKIRSFIIRAIASGFAMVVATLPLTLPTYADTTPPDATGNSCFIIGSDQPGNHRPSGAESSLYSYNCTTNLWESAHYTYSPITGVKLPKETPVYTYNPATGLYDTQTWDFSATKATYILTSHSVVTPPVGATVIGAPAPIPPSSTISNTGPGSNNTINNDGTSGGTSTINGTGANSNNGTVVAMANTILGQASTGNVSVLANTTAGNAISGNALDQATIVNMLQSSSNALGSGNAVTFVANIDGDVNGDLLLDPASLTAIQPATDATNNVTINNSADTSITNNVDLTAKSGDVTVSKNTTAGNATSGSAQAIANVVNLINSAISSGQSFIGTININGNLNGDILVPQDFIDQLIATNVPTVTITNTGDSSNNTVTNSGSQNTTVNNTNNQGINNNVTSSASSGSANSSENTTAGNASSGSAGTSITAFNLTGSNIIGSNDLLVFVNVVGKWVGMIVNAPAGATAAELGSGVSSNTTNGDTTINNTNNSQITNNINVAAKSGDVSATKNTSVGNATSGNASTAVNLLNVQNSSLAFSNWFGILFINVFGTWNGSFGMNTSAGDPVVASPSGTSAGGVQSPVFRFVPRSTSVSNTGANSNNTVYNLTPATTAVSSAPVSAGAVLAAHTNKIASAIPTPSLSPAKRSLVLPIISISLFVAFIVIERYGSRAASARK